MGNFDDAQKLAIETFSNDLVHSRDYKDSEIGHRQYSELRRFLDLFSRYWRDTKSIGRVSQIINSAKFRR